MSDYVQAVFYLTATGEITRVVRCQARTARQYLQAGEAYVDAQCYQPDDYYVDLGTLAVTAKAENPAACDTEAVVYSGDTIKVTGIPAGSSVYFSKTDTTYSVDDGVFGVAVTQVNAIEAWTIRVTHPRYQTAEFTVQVR